MRATTAAWVIPALIAVSAAVPAPAQEVSDSEKKKIESIVRDYLVANPEVVVDALRAYESKRQVQAEQAAQAAVSAHRDALERDPTSPSAGNPKGDVTVVEFFDYRCGYCKKVLPTMQEVLKSDPGIRTVFKEFPILGPDSVQAALAAQAVWTIAPDKYLPFHVALMSTRGTIDETVIADTAKKVGVDPAKLKTAMADPAVKAKINANLELAQSLQINGTPAFIVGGKLLPGAVDLATLRETIAEARTR